MGEKMNAKVDLTVRNIILGTFVCCVSHLHCSALLNSINLSGLGKFTQKLNLTIRSSDEFSPFQTCLSCPLGRGCQGKHYPDTT